ncbi:MAG: ABC transporter permease [Deltaproteobacteria bacterium]|nr:ABC transporter permease [Deltaproteobacteria bacterium]
MYFVRRALRNFREELGLHMRVVSGFGMMVLVFSGYLLAIRNLDRIVERWGHELQVVAYLKDGIGSASAARIISGIQKDPAVHSAEYVSPELAMKRFREDLGSLSGVLEGLTVNPLPASIEISIRAEQRDAATLRDLASRVGQMEDIEDVQYGEGWIERYDTVIGVIRTGGWLLGLFLLVITLGAVTNTVQLVIFARRDEIGILRLVGATETFIRVPFMIEGLIGGFLAAAAGLGMLGVLFLVLASRIEAVLQGWLGYVSLVFLPLPAILAIIAACMAIGLVSSTIAAGRHLRV